MHQSQGLPLKREAFSFI